MDLNKCKGNLMICLSKPKCNDWNYLKLYVDNFFRKTKIIFLCI